MNSHLIFGAGLIGGFLAGGLLQHGLRTGIVARERVQKAMANGLVISDFEDNKTSVAAPEFVSTETADQFVADALWLTVKCTAVASVIDDLQYFVGPETIIICCQNGFGSDQAVRDAVPDHRVLGAVVGFNVAEPAAGHLHRSTEGKLVVESAPELGIDALVEKINTGLLPATVSHDFVADQWAKLQLNLANPVNALADIPVKTMLEDRNYRHIIATLMDELLSATDA